VGVTEHLVRRSGAREHEQSLNGGVYCWVQVRQRCEVGRLNGFNYGPGVIVLFEFGSVVRPALGQAGFLDDHQVGQGNKD